MDGLLGPQFDAEIAYRQERTRHEFAPGRRQGSGLRQGGGLRQGSGLRRLIARHRRPAAPILGLPSR